MIEHYFVTGTDTEVGKTYFCGRQIEKWMQATMIAKEIKIAYIKPVQTGLEDSIGDGETILSTLPPSDKIAMKSHIHVLKQYSKSASPQLASRLAGEKIDFASLVEMVSALLENYTHAVIEGAGGVLVPLVDEKLMLDLIIALALPVILVARAGLGTINHTLLTVEALRQKNITIDKIVLNPYFAEKIAREVILDNALTIGKIAQIPVEWIDIIN